MVTRTLGVFFTAGISVELWYRKGLFFREKLIYEKLLEQKIFDKIYWFTYGINDKDYKKYLPNGVKIIPMPKIFNFNIGRIIYSILMPLLQRRYLKECHILKTNQMWGSWTAVISKILYKKPLVVRTGYTISLFSLKENKKLKYFINRIIEKIAYKFADSAIVASRKDYRYVVKRYNPKEIGINPNYIDISLFKPLTIKKEGDVVFVGRLSHQKNVFNLIKAFEDLNYTLDIYGDGELREKIEKLIKNLKLKNVKLKGVVPNSELPKILNQYKVFVLPSFYEGTPKALLEAMACGLACLGTNVEGIKEVIHGKNGWLVGTDAHEIRKGVKILMENELLRKKLGRNARKTIEKKFSLEKVAEKEAKVYKSMFEEDVYEKEN